MNKIAEAMPRYLTLKEAAAYLALSTKSLYRLVEARRIPFAAITISKGSDQSPQRLHYRFDRIALDEFMASQAVVPPKCLATSGWGAGVQRRRAMDRNA